jgi:hypothetical protein
LWIYSIASDLLIRKPNRYPVNAMQKSRRHLFGNIREFSLPWTMNRLYMMLMACIRRTIPVPIMPGKRKGKSSSSLP